MKGTLYSIKGIEKEKIDLPIFFREKIREDIILKCLNAERILEIQPYSPDPMAGRKHSASGKISHKRRDFKGHYGRGISRIPRKVMWRRGTQFFWVGAEINSARGGRAVHPPSLLKRIRKINKKEREYALYSALSATTKKEFILSRYSTLKKLTPDFPIIIESKLENMKTKEFLKLLKKLLDEAYPLALKKKKIRAGRGKMRGRKYKSNAGLLLIKSKEENFKFQGVDIKTINQLAIKDLYPLGRLTIFTEKALNKLKDKK